MNWFPQPSKPSPVGFVALAANPANPAKPYNHFHNILRLFDVLSNFPFTTSETMGDYYLQT